MEGRATGGTRDQPGSALTCPEAQELVDLVLGMKNSIAVAESCTGGLVAAVLAGAADSGDCFRGGLIAYDEHVKFDLLNVARGPVITAAAAAQMANGIAQLLHADVGLATSGVMGPSTEEGRPLGTLCLGLRLPNQEVVGHEVQLEEAAAATMRQDAVRAALIWALETMRAS